MLQTVLDALCELRSPFALYENDIHRFVEARLKEAGLPYRHEARIGPGCRIGYWWATWAWKSKRAGRFPPRL